MNFALTEDQAMIRDSAQVFLADESGSAAVRKAVWPLIESGKFKPVIEKTYPLAQIDAAHAHMAGSHIGKILLTL